MAGWHSKYLQAQAGLTVVGWDLDSTVRSTMHRRHLIPAIHEGSATWDDYSLACADDEPVEGAVALMRLLSGEHLNIAVSACSEAALELTRDWCRKYQVPLADFILRPAGDCTENGVFKVASIRRLQDAGLKVVLFVEDWGPVAKFIHEQTGIPVLGVNPFDPGTVLVTRGQLADAMAKYGCHGAGDCGTECADAVFSHLGGAF